MSRLALAVLVLALGALGACSNSEKREPPHPSTDAEVVATLESRTAAKSLYAVVSIAYDDSRAHGTFKAVVQYKAPGRIRITAFKDVALLASGSVFDFLITPEVFALEIAPQAGSPGESDRGPVGDLAVRHPGFRGFAWARETLFLPGNVGGVPAKARKLHGVVEVRYADFRDEGGATVPGSIDYEDREQGTRMAIRLLSSK